jgi:tight adherence protein B
MLAMGLLLAGASTALIFWLLHRSLTNAWVKYHESLSNEAESRLADMFVFVDLSQLWPLLVALAFVMGLLGWLLSDSVAVSMGVAVLVLAVPRLLLARAHAARKYTLDRQLPDALRILAAALSSGSSFSTALSVMAKDLNPPLSQELSLILREQRVGIPLQDALENFRLRICSESVGQVTTLLRVGAESGGSLALLLDKLSLNLSEQQYMSLKVEMLTTQGKMQAWVIGVLPLILLGVLCWLDPNAMQLAMSSGVGQVALVTIAVLELIGLVWLRAILRAVCHQC